MTFYFSFGKKGLDSVKHNKVDLIYPFGFETSDRRSFLSFNDSNSLRVERKVRHYTVSHNSFEITEDIQLSTGKISIHLNEKTFRNQIKRKHTVEAITDCELFDVVSRFQFRFPLFQTVQIGGQEITHQLTQKNHTFDVKKVILNGSKFGARVNILKAKTAGLFKPVLYARDAKERWVIHARLLPISNERGVIKLNRQGIDDAIPEPFNSWLLSIPPVHDFLWYKGEKRYSRIPFNAFPLVKLEKGTEISIETSCSFSVSKNGE